MSPEDLAFEMDVKWALSVTYDGIHHVPYWERRIHNGRMIELSLDHGIATADYPCLSLLVIACHEICLRLELRASGPGLIKARFHPRKRDGDYMDRHPTIEEHIECVRRKMGTWNQ